MPSGYRISLANGQLEVGDDGQTSQQSFTTSQTIGAGSIDYTYINVLLTYSSTANGTYQLGTDGNVYFVPSSGLSGNVQTIDVRTAPTFAVTMGTSGNDTNLTGTTASDLIYGGNTTTATTNSGSDTIHAGAGSDTVYARDGNDTVYGEAGNDTIYAETGNDVAYGGDGNDLLSMGDGTDTAYGGAGSDSILGGAGADSLSGGAGSDTIDGGTEADTIAGGEGNDSILGGDGNDVIHGDSTIAPAASGSTEHLSWSSQGASGTAVSSFTQDTGNMSVTFSQTNDGALQNTTISASGQYVGNNEPFATNSGLLIQGTGGANISTSVLTFAADANSGLSDSVTNIGFRINDIDEGPWRDVITVRAYDANGNLVTVNMTASGNDTVNGSTVTAGNGGDAAASANGSVYVSIPGPAVRIEIEFDNSGGNTANLIFLTDIYYTTTPLSEGNDTIDGGAGDDLIYGDGGSDTIYGGIGNDVIDGGAGYDWIDSGDGSDTVYGGADGDFILYGSGNNLVYGGAGNDVIDDVAGYAVTGASTIYGDAGNDSIWGSLSNDLIYGGADDDQINADQGDDTIYGGDGNDLIWGNAGNDTFYGGAGNDAMAGEAGNDVFNVTDADGIETIYGGENTGDWDTVNLGNVSSAAGVTVTFTGNEAANYDFDGTTAAGAFVQIEQLNTTAYADTINASATTAGMSINTGTGNDSVLGGSGNDYVQLGAGADRIDAGQGNDTILLGSDANNDTVVFNDGDGTDRIYDFAAPTANGDGTYTGTDRLDVSGLHDAQGNPVYTSDVVVSNDGSGNAVLTFPNGESIILMGISPATLSTPQALNAIGIPIVDGTVTGTAGSDNITSAYTGDPDGDRVDNNDNILAGKGANDDVINALGGNDTVNAGIGNDTVYGGSGTDTITGGAGNDVLYGGTEADTFVLGDGWGSDTVVGGEGGETGNGDVLDGAGLTTNVTVNFTGAETGTFTSGTNTVSFSQLEGISTGSGNDSVMGSSGSDSFATMTGADTVNGGAGNDFYSIGNYPSLTPDTDSDLVIFGDGGGADMVFGFSAPVVQADGTYTAVDHLDVSGMHDAQGNPVNVHDVTVVNYGGHAQLVFPNGESIVLWNVSPTTMTNLQALNAIGIPMSDGTVTGTGGNDVIDTNYVGDPDGDRVDDNDNVIAGKGANDDIISAGAGADTVLSGTGNDTVYGGSGTDSITGGAGNDVLYGGTESDTFFLNDGWGSDTVVGGEGGETGNGDVLHGENLTTDVTVTLTGAETGTFVSGTNTVNFSQIEGVSTGSGDDSFTGSAGSDSFATMAGADTVEGGAGDDYYVIGNYPSLTPDADSDLVIFGDGDGADMVLGFSAPVLQADGSFTAIDHLDVSDLHDAQGNPVNVHDVTVVNYGGHAQLVFPNGESIVLYGVNPATMTNPKALAAIGIPSSDGTITGTAGDDVIDGSYLGDPDGDRVDDNDAVLAGDSGNDDLIRAGAGNDSVAAGNGNDEVYGGTGNDVINGGAGNDTLLGEAGDDRFVVSAGHGNDTVTGGETGETSGDVLDASGMTSGVNLTLSTPESGTLSSTGGTVTFSEIEEVRLTDYADSVTGSSSGDTVSAGGGNDTVFANGGNDVIDGGAGSDTIYGGTGDDVIYGGTGADSLTGDAGNDTIHFAQGDTVVGGTGDDLFVLDDLGELGTGTITIDGSGGNETTGDTLQLGTLADWSTLVKTDDGTGSFSGSIRLDNGTILNFSEIENIICFTPGTRIATPRGARPIETLRVGDMVVTRDHGLQPIRWIQQRTVPAMDKFAPIRIRPGVVTGLERDLLVSPQHRMLFQGYRAELLFGESEVLVSAKHLVDGLDVTEEHGGMVTYIHMMFDQHEVVYAEGAATESFHPGDVGLAAVSDSAREELFTLFPELRAMPTSYGRTARRCLKKHEAKLLVP